MWPVGISGFERESPSSSKFDWEKNIFGNSKKYTIFREAVLKIDRFTFVLLGNLINRDMTVNETSKALFYYLFERET